MKYIIPLIFLFAFSSQDQIDTSKALIIYFSRTGNTELSYKIYIYISLTHK